MLSGAYGSQAARNFDLSAAPSLVVGENGAVKIAVTRLRRQAALPELTRPPVRERAYSIHLHLEDSADQELWLSGRRAFRGGYTRGATSLVNLEDEPVARIGNAFDILQIYVPCASLEELALEHGGGPTRELSGVRGTQDPGSARLASLLLVELDGPKSSRLYVDQLMLALRVHVAQRYAGSNPSLFGTAGGLSGRQERLAKDLLQSRLAESISIADLARECGLSPSHFTRAFRQSTGMQPHRWLSNLRIDAAKRLLLEGRLSLADVALAIGFNDQSHFTRTFTRQMGTSPGAWQRDHRRRAGPVSLCSSDATSLDRSPSDA